MRKATKLMLLIFITGIMISTTFVKGDYVVSIGQIFTYEVNRSEWSVTEGTNTADAEGFRIINDSFAPGTNFAVLVTDVNPTISVSYNMTAGSTTYSGSNQFADLANFKAFCLYLNFLASAGGFSPMWNQDEMDAGPSIIRWFFSNIGEDYIFKTLRELANETEISEFTTTAGYNQTTVQGHFDESSTIAVFDWLYEGTIHGSTANTEMIGYELLKFAFDTDTGVMKGYRIEIDFSGIVEGVERDYYILQEVELLSYDLPLFIYTPSIGTGKFLQWLSDNKWYIIGIGGGLLVTIIIVSVVVTVRKKKK